VIRLTRIDQRRVAINCDLIEWVEANPDTTVRMVSGESILVLESVDEVIRRVGDYRKNVLAAAGLAALATSGRRSMAGIVRRAADGTLRMPNLVRDESERGEEER
jgi:flagellar protein FlbD